MKPKLIAMLALLLYLLSACGTGRSGHEAIAPSHPASPTTQALTLSSTPSFRMGDTLAQAERALHSKPLVKAYAGGSTIWSTWYYFLRDPRDTASGTPQARITIQTDGAGPQSRVIKIIFQPWKSEIARGKRVTFAQCDFGPADAQPVQNHQIDMVIGVGEYFNLYSASLARDIAPDAWRTGNPGGPVLPGTTFLSPIFDGSFQNIIGCMWSLGTV